MRFSKSLLLGLCFAVVASASPPSPSRASARTALIESELADSGGVFFTIGASNTAGFGLRFGLRDRILHHLVTKNASALQSLTINKKCFGLSIDRFFPTAFPMLTDPAVSDETLRAEVVSILKPMLKCGCTVVIADLFAPGELTPELKAFVAKSLPLKRMNEALGIADPSGHRIAVVNKTLSEMSTGETRLKLVHFNEALTRLPDSKVLDGHPMVDFFQHGGDDIHANYSGQALFFNLFARAELEKLAGVPVSPMVTAESYPPSWEEEVVRVASTLSPSVKGEARILNRDALKQDSHQVSGSHNKGVLTKAGDLVLIDKSIRSALSSQAASLSLARRRDSSGEKIYELDLTKLAYTKIALKQSAMDPKVFVGVGSDYWGYAIGLFRVNSPAFTNYVFVLREVDEKHLELEWTIVPQLVFGNEVQQLPKERMATLVDPKNIWMREIQDNLTEYDRLSYKLETEVKWMTK